MLTIAKLFGKSPFAPLKTHMKIVEDCVKHLIILFETVEKKDLKRIKEISTEISKIEHEADLTKNDIRNHLPKSLFMPIDRTVLLEILALQDSFADKAEDISVICTLRALDNYEDMKEDFEPFYLKNIETVSLTKDVIREFDLLLESSFGGMEARKVKAMIEHLAVKEHELDLLGYKLIKKIFDYGDKLPYPIFSLWQTIIREVGDLSNNSEKLGNRIRMILELK